MEFKICPERHETVDAPPRVIHGSSNDSGLKAVESKPLPDLISLICASCSPLYAGLVRRRMY